MKTSRVMLLIMATAAAGWCAIRWWQPGAAPAAPRILFYQSPMHPWVKSDAPGQCTVCGMDLVPIREGGKTFDSEMPEIVMLPAGSPAVMHVQTSAVTTRPLVRTLKVSGLITEDMTRHYQFTSPVEGRIDGLSMNHPGQQVTKRQPLVTLFSRTLLTAADDYKLALPQGGTSLEQATRRLTQYGLVWEQIESIPQRQPDDIHFGVLSPVSGVIVKSYVSEGTAVWEGSPLFEIADFTTMWFMFSAYEPDLPFLKPRQFVHVRTAALPGETLTSRVYAVDPNLDPLTHSTMVRVVLENPDRKLLVNAFAEADVELEAPDVLAVPRSAVLWSGNDPRVYLEQSDGTYEQCLVKLGRCGDTDWEVLSGLSEDDRVVTEGGMLIDGQARLNNFAAPDSR